MRRLRRSGKSLRAISANMKQWGFAISHVGVKKHQTSVTQISLPTGCWSRLASRGCRTIRVLSRKLATTLLRGFAKETGKKFVSMLVPAIPLVSIAFWTNGPLGL
jgi:hypothetical protein